MDDRHEAVMLGEALKKKPGHAPVLLRLAQLSEQRGEYPAAVGHLRDVLSSEPDNAEAQLELGRILFAMGDISGALEQTQTLLDKRPGDADALYNLGAIHANVGNAVEAQHYWEKLIRLKPDAALAQRARGMLNELAAATRNETARLSSTGNAIAQRVHSRSKDSR